MKIDKDFLAYCQGFKTPFLFFDLRMISKNYKRVESAFPGVEIFYAMKCNPLARIIETLKLENSGFEVASLNETKQLINQQVAAEKIMCLHPIKSPEFLKFLNKKKIEVVAADSYEEIDKIAKFHPRAKILIRVAVDNIGSSWPLTKKFGIEVTEFPRILKYTREKGLTLSGLTFHVGSQCENEANWLKALDLCNNIWRDALKENISMDFLSLGGGLAVEYNKPVPSVEEIGKLVMKKIGQNFKTKYKKLKITIEPGRALVANSAVLVTSVIGTATRGKDNWAYIETGTYNGLVEAIETSDRNFYPIEVLGQKNVMKSYFIGGPSCVSLDTPFEQTLLPELSTEDKLIIKNAGAYTVTCAGPFNGFPVPKIYFRNQ